MRNFNRWISFSAISVCLLLAASAWPEDWPQWRGLNRDGHSRETGLLKEWSKEGPRLLWQVNELGRGYATPSVAGGRIYLMSNQGLEDEFVNALDGKDGKKIWSTRIGKVGNPDPKLPTAIGGAVLVGDYLYGSSQTLMCVEYKTGQVKWNERSIAPASMCYAEGLLYMHGEEGDVALVEASPDAYRERGRFTPPNQPKHNNPMEKSWPYPVVADGRLYIRDLDTMWCYDIRAPK